VRGALAATAGLATAWALGAAAAPFPWTGGDLTRPVDEVATLTVTGDPGGRAGFAVAVTDWNRDGSLDVVVAEPWADVDVAGEAVRKRAGRIGIFLAPFVWRTDGDPLWAPRTLSMDDADVVVAGPAGARLGYRMVADPAGPHGPALAVSLPDLTGGRDAADAAAGSSPIHAGEVWLLDGSDGALGALDARDVLWGRGRLWWDGQSADGQAWAPLDLGYELAALDDLDGDGVGELAIAVPSVAVYDGELPVELGRGGTLIVPGQRILDGELGSVTRGWFLTPAVDQLEPVFTGAAYLPRLAAHGPDGLLIGELMHHRGAGAVSCVPASSLPSPAPPTVLTAAGWPDPPGASGWIQLGDDTLTVVGEGTAVGGEFAFGSAFAALDGAPVLAIAALQSTSPGAPPRAATELVWRADLEGLAGPLAETDDLAPWRILGDEHGAPAWLDEASAEAALGQVAAQIEAASGWWTFLLAACLLFSPEGQDHQCLADFAALFQYAPVAMAPYPRSAHVPVHHGDGLVIGEPLFDGGRGALHAVLPDWARAPDGAVELAPLATPPDGWAVSRLDGGPDAWLGHAVAAPGDLDGDGLDDLLVGAPGRPPEAGEDAPAHGAAHLLLSRLHADRDGDGVGVSAGDCDDTDPESYPGAPELCDGRDNDCDGVVPADEGDSDGDGHLACGGPGGDPDCDDNDPALHPLDGDGDGWSPCDGDCDDGDPALEPADRDGDGFSTCDGDCDDGDPALGAGDRDGDGWTTCGSADGADCDDGDAGVHPGAAEIADAVDNDCDGRVDEGVPVAMGCGWTDGGRTADRRGAGVVLALSLLLGLRLRPARPWDRRGAPRSTPTG